MGIEPTTSGLDLPSLCRLSYKVAQTLLGHYTNILAIASRELVAAEACYHKSCYRNHTRPTGERVSGTGSADDKEYNDIESEAHQKLFDYVRSNILGNPRLVKFTEITQQLVLFMEELGANVIRESTKTHLHRKLKTEFKSLYNIAIC